MKVIQIKLRTPGIFLGEPDPEQGIPTPNLTLKVREKGIEEEWTDINEYDPEKIQALSEAFLPSGSDEQGYVTTGSIQTKEVSVPLQGEGEKVYNLRVVDGKTFEYRIEAYPCVDCVDVYRTYRRDDEIINGLGVVAASGEIKS